MEICGLEPVKSYGAAIPVSKNQKLGLLLLSSYMSGAITLHMTHGEPFILLAAFLMLIWITGFIKNPEFFKLANEHK